MTGHSGLPVFRAGLQKPVPDFVGLPETAKVWIRSFRVRGHDTWGELIESGARQTGLLAANKIAAHAGDLLAVAASRKTVAFVQFRKFMHERAIERFCRENGRYKPIGARVLLAHSEADEYFCRYVKLERVRIVALSGRIENEKQMCVVTVHHTHAEGSIRREARIEPYAGGFGEEHVFGFEVP